VTSESVPTGHKASAPPRLDARVAQLATLQHGVVTSAQLAQLGLGRSGISKRVENGSLHRVHRGVYAVGHPRLADRGLWIAAVLAAGEGAALAGLSAAALWRISRWVPDEIHVIAPRKHARHGFRLQTCRRLDPRDLTRHAGIPVTTVARTLVDLSDVLTPHQLANVIHEAAFRKRFSEAATRAAMARANGRRRLERLEAALVLDGAGTKSALEDRFLEAVAELPPPDVNVTVAGLEVDFRWPGVIVEVDGPGHRRGRTKREDRAREETLTAAGYRVIRIEAEGRSR
jgi:hypothetical protein